MRKALLLLVVLGVLGLGTMTASAQGGDVQTLLGAGQQTVTVGNLLLDETFDSSDAWEAYQQDSDINLKVAKGVYRMFTKIDGLVWGVNSQSHSDVVIEADTLQNSEELNNAYGVVCRAGVDNDGTGYYFRISGDGYYNITRADKDEIVQLVEWTETNAVKQGQNRNHITAVCVGDYLALYVNDQLVAETNDSTYTEGFGALSISAFADDNNNVNPTDVSFDNVRIYEASSGSSGNNGSVQSVVLEDYTKGDSVIRQLRDLGFIPRNSNLLFTEDYAYFTGQGNWFQPLASRMPRNNVVFGGELSFWVGNLGEWEQCTFSAGIQTDNNGTAVRYIDFGLSNAGEAFVLDRFSENQDSNYTIANGTYDLDYTHYVILVLLDGRASLFVDGQLVIQDFEVGQRSGSYGISLVGKGKDARCEGHNIWAYELP